LTVEKQAAGGGGGGGGDGEVGHMVTLGMHSASVENELN